MDRDFEHILELEDLQALHHHCDVSALNLLTLQPRYVTNKGCDERRVLLSILEVPRELVQWTGDDDGFPFEPKKLQGIPDDIFIETPIVQHGD